MAKRAKHPNEGEKPRKRRGRRLLTWTGAGLAVAAVAQELSKPAEQRTWTGRVGGLVPYDLRWPPTAERFKAALWNPKSGALFTPHAFGVGWSVNFARVVQLAEEALDASKR